MIMHARYEILHFHLIFRVVLSSPLSANMCQLRHKSSSKVSSFSSQKSFQNRSELDVEHQYFFHCIFSSILGPKTLPKITKMDPKSIKIQPKVDKLPQGASKMLPRRPKTRPRRPQEAPKTRSKTPPDLPRGSKTFPKGPPDPPKTHPKPPKRLHNASKSV